VTSDAVVVPAETAQQLAIAVNELAMNAAKHAYPWGHRGALYVDCRRRGETLVLVVSDDGHGLGSAFAAKRDHGLGMSIVEAIVRQLRGTFHAADDNGARFTITAPLPSATAPPAPRSFAKGD
jgi:two-component sensor histidine kinase